MLTGSYTKLKQLTLTRWPTNFLSSPLFGLICQLTKSQYEQHVKWTFAMVAHNQHCIISYMQSANILNAQVITNSAKV